MRSPTGGIPLESERIPRLHVLEDPAFRWNPRAFQRLMLGLPGMDRLAA
jgi:hypothetical protein